MTNDIDTIDLSALKCKPVDVPSLEKEMLKMPQADCPVVHHFGNGIYMREVRLSKGLICIGHKQKKEHLNVMLTGRVMMLDSDGNLNEVKAPFIKNSPAGRKVGFVLEDTVWLNIYSTNETDIETLENTYLDKSIGFKENEKILFNAQYALRQCDRDDFDLFCKEYSLTKEQIQKETEMTADLVDMPLEWRSCYSLRQSPISGKGIFGSKPFEKEEIIAPARIGNGRTDIGRYTNHSHEPNCIFKKINNDVYLVANRNINGCAAGTHGEELTVSYRQVMELKCQE